MIGILSCYKQWRASIVLKKELHRLYLIHMRGVAKLDPTTSSYIWAENYLMNFDKEQVFDWYCYVSNIEDARDQYVLGQRYLKGDGVIKDYQEAIEWLRLAADQGFALAQFELGNCFYYGVGVDKNPNEVLKWYRMAAEGGLAIAQSYLASVYGLGKLVSQDFKEAVRWYRLAAEQNNIKAQTCLALTYKKVKDFESAYFWILIAVLNGDESSIVWRDLIAKQLTTQQQDEVQARARKWYEEHQC